MKPSHPMETSAELSQPMPRALSNAERPRLDTRAPSADRFTDVIAGPAEMPETKLRAYVIEVVEGPDRGHSVRVERGSLLIGSSPDSDLCLTDSTVSRAHVKLVPFADGVEITDLDSKNGTFLSGTRLMHARVAPGTEFTVGHTTIRVAPDDKRTELAPSELTKFGPIRGRSRAMRQLFAALELAAKSDSPLLLQGERGTGRMRAARAVHDMSPRAAEGVVVIDGRLEEGVDMASAAALATGTIIFRDVDRLKEPAQRTLLGLLESGAIKARIVATTTKDLQKLASAGQFDRDLAFRLAILKIGVPALRDRASDLPILIEDILAELGHPRFELGPADLGRMQAYAWPDNISELKAVIQGAVSFEGAPLTDEVPGRPQKPSEAVVGADLPYKQARAHMIEAFEREYVRGLLDRHEGNVSRAARAAGIDRVYLHRLLRKYGL